MDNSTWILIAVIAAAVVIVVAVIALAIHRKGEPARREQRRTEARDARREAEFKAADATRLDAEARLRAAAAEEKAAFADMAKAEARQEAVLAEDDHHEAEVAAREAAETFSRADRLDPSTATPRPVVGTTERQSDEAPDH